MSGSDQFPPGFRQRLLRNTLFGAGGRVIGLAVSFFLTPFIVHSLGGPHYAIYALASILSGYLSLLDLGLGTGYVKYVAEAAARDEFETVNEILASGFYAYLGLGLGMLAVWGLAHDAVLSLLMIEPDLRTEALQVFTISVFILALSGAAAAFRAVLYGLQRIDVAAKIGVALIVPKLVLVIGALALGLGVVGLALADLVLFVAGAGAMAVAARSLFPALSLRPSRCSRRTLEKLVGYGVRLQVSRASELINFHLDKLLLARFVGLRSVTDYDLGAKLLATTRSFPLLALSALVPAVSELESLGLIGAVDRIAIRTLRLLLIISTPAFVLLALEAPLVVEIWLGPGHQASAVAVRVLALGYLANTVAGSFTTITQGIARNDYQMKLAFFALSVNIVLSLALVWRFGYLGVLIGTVVSLTAMYFYAEVAFHRLAREYLPTATRGGARLYLGPAAAAAAASVAAVAAHALLGEGPGGRLEALAHLGAGAAVFSAVYPLVLWLLGGLDGSDLAYVRRSVVAVRRRLGAADV